MKKYIYILMSVIIGIFANYTENKAILFISCIFLIFFLYKIFKEYGIIGDES